MSPETSRYANPFPGLRPFRSDEHHLFFGREEQTAALLQLLRESRFLAVVGTSGSGKSSLVRAGLIAELHGGTMTHAGSTWEVVVLRPGGSPIENLARAMVEADLYDAEDPSTLPRLRATLTRSRFGLVEAMRQSDVFEPGVNLLVVVDQFEELFRFRQQGVDSEETATAFVNLLLTAGEQAEYPIYVAITMRSDYLGDCSEIPGLAEAVNEGEYLIPRLRRDQKRDAIEKPIGVGGARISPLLVQRLLNDVGDDPDQLPVLQHALMRMWEVWAAGEDRNRPIDLSDFEATGGLASALSNHADEIYDSLPDDRHRSVCERVFKSLTEKGADNRGIRRPARLALLQAIADTDRRTLTAMLDAFRRAGVTFLMPGMDTELTERTVIDLSHESLMRGWQRLRMWVEEESQSARIFRRLLDTARLWSEGNAGLFRNPDLQIAISWRDAEQPNAEWADQYGGQFQTAINFLEASNAEAEAERNTREAARQRELEQAQRLAEAERQRAADQARTAVRFRRFARGLAVVAILALAATVFAWRARQEARDNANVAARRAQEANQQRTAAVTAQKETEQALNDVAAAKELADQNLLKAKAAEDAALAAELRSREFRYATDIQLAGVLIDDESANASQVLGRLADYDPKESKDLAGKDDLRGFEWYYLKRLVEARANVIAGFGKEVVTATLSPEGELVTLDGDARLQYWNSATRQETRPGLDLKKGRSVTAQALSRDGRRAALAIGDRVQLIDALTGEEAPLAIPAKARCGLVFSPDGRMLITVDTDVAWWDAATGKPIARQEFQLTAHAPGYHPVSVAADGLTLAVGGQGNYRDRFSVFKMSPETREVTRLLDKTGTSNATKRALAISPDGGTVAVSLFFQGTVYLYDVKTGSIIGTHDSAHTAPIASIGFNPDGTQLVTAAMDGSIKVWEDYNKFETSKSTSLLGHPEEVAIVAFVANGKQVLSAGKDKTVRLWNLEQSWDSVYRTVAGAKLAGRVRYSPDGSLMAVSGDSQRIQLRDGVTGAVVAQLPERNDELDSSSVAFSPDGRLLAAGFGGKIDTSFIELWDIDRRQRLAVLPGSTAIPDFNTSEYSGAVPALAFSPSGRHLVAGFGSLQSIGYGDRGNHPLLVYDVAAKRVVRRLEGHRNDCVSVAFSPDGSRLASASYDGTVRIWNAATWTEQRVLNNSDAQTDLGHGRVCDVAFSPNGKWLAMASAEGNVIIWNAESGAQLLTLSGHANEVWCVAFSPNGRTLASGSTDGTIRLWNTATWRELARLTPKTEFSPKSLTFSPDGTRLLAGEFRAEPFIWSVQPAGDDVGPTPERLVSWLDSGLDFANRIRLQSEHLQLHETLQTLSQERPGDTAIQAALAATRANWLASRDEWKGAVEQFDRLQKLSPESPHIWLRAPGLLRIATALLHEGRPAEATSLLAGGEQRRADDGSGTQSLLLGIFYDLNVFPWRLVEVTPGFPAWRAGLRPGDRLLKINEVEVTQENATQLQEMFQGGAGTKIRVTVQHPGQESTEIVELTKSSHVADEVTNRLIEKLLAAVDQVLANSPEQPEVRELRAALFGQSSDYEAQLADYTRAIELLSQRTGDAAAAECARLYRERGDTFAGLKQWRQAAEDYSQGVTHGTTDGQTLANQARAEAELLLETHWEVVKPSKMESSGGSTLSLQDDGSILASGENPQEAIYTLTAGTELKRIRRVILQTLPDPSLPGNGPGRYGANGNFHLYELRVFSGGVLVPLTDISVEHDEWRPTNGQAAAQKAIDGDVRTGAWGDGRQGQGNLAVITTDFESTAGDLKVELHFRSQHNLGHFRLFVTDAPASLEDSQRIIQRHSSGDPWGALATLDHLIDEKLAIDRLVRRHPKNAGALGDVYITGDPQNWNRAVEFYSIGLAAENHDNELFAKRARAYEALKNWDAAAADWRQASPGDFERAKLLADFTRRLVGAGQFEIAAEQQQRARRLLESILVADPNDRPVLDRLSQLLLDSANAAPWTVLTPVENKTLNGSAITTHADRSFEIEPAASVTLPVRETISAARLETSATTIVVADEEDSLILPALSEQVKAIRVDTAASPTSTGTASSFKDYRIEALDTARSRSGTLKGRYVRLDLPGDNLQFPRFAQDGTSKVINFAEMQVFRGEENIALNQPARQSSIAGDEGKFGAKNAVNGDTQGTDDGHPYAHTNSEAEPSWEVDLGSERPIDRIVIWNRTDSCSERTNHFRVRVLDSIRNVVFEQVVDKAPSPSTEISCQSMFAAKMAAPGDKTEWQLQLGKIPGFGCDSRLRVSATEEIISLAREEAIAEARLLADPAARLAAAYDYNHETGLATDWFRRALNGSKTDVERKPILGILKSFPDELSELLRQQPDDSELRLTLARYRAAKGEKMLSRQQAHDALIEFQSASDIFAGLLEDAPEPEWTVLTPMEMSSQGGATLTPQRDGSILVSGINPDEDRYTVSTPAHLNRITALRLEALPDPSLPQDGPGRSEDNGNFHLNELQVFADGNPVHLENIAVRYDETNQFHHVIDGKIDSAWGWSNHPRSGQANTAVVEIDPPVEAGRELRFELYFSRGDSKRHGLGRFRLSATTARQGFAGSALRLELPSELASLDVAIGRAFAVSNQPAEAAAAFERALNRIPGDHEKPRIIERLKEHLEALQIVAEQRPGDLTLQLALAGSLADSGKRMLAERSQVEAVSQLSQARDIYSRLITEHPEPNWTVLRPTAMTSEGGAVLTLQPDESILVTGTNPNQDVYTLSLDDLSVEEVSAIRLEALTDPALPKSGPGRFDNGNFILTRIELLRSNSKSVLPWAASYADFEQKGYEVKKAIDKDVESGWAIHAGTTATDRVAIFSLQNRWNAKEDTARVRLEFKGDYKKHNLGRFRLSATSHPNAIEVAQFHRDLKNSGLADLEISLANTAAREDRIDEAAAAILGALRLSADRNAKVKTLRESSISEAVLQKLTQLEPADPALHGALSRYFQERGDAERAQAFAARTRSLYESELESHPANARVAQELADFLMDISPIGWQVLRPVDMKSSGGAKFAIQQGGSVLVSGPNVSADRYTLSLQSDLRIIHGIRLEVLPDDSLPSKGPGRHPTGNFQLAKFRVFGPNVEEETPPAPVPISTVRASFAYEATDADVAGTIDETSEKVWHVWGHSGVENHADYQLVNALQIEPGQRLTIELEHNRYDPGINLGHFRLSATDGGNTIEDERLRQIAKQTGSPWTRLGIAYIRNKEVDKAVDVLAQAIESAGTDQTRWMAAKDAAALEVIFTRLLERFPDEQLLHLGRATYLAENALEQNKYATAIDQFSILLQQFPENLEFLKGRAEAYSQSGNWSASAADYARIVELESDFWRRYGANLTRGEILLRMGDTQQGAELYFENMLLDPASIDRPRDALIAELLAGNADLARTATKRLYELTHTLMAGGYPWGRVQVFTAQPGLVTKENLPQLLEAAKVTGAADAPRMTAALYYRLGDLKLAAPLLTTSGDHPQFEALAAMLLYDQGQVEQARQRLINTTGWLERERAKDPGSAIPRQVGWQDWGPTLAVWREATRKLLGAPITELDAELRKEPGNANLLLVRARLLSDAGLHEEAFSDLNRALQLRPDDANLINECAAQYEESDEPQRAVAIYSQLIDRRRNSAPPAQLAEGYRLRGAHYVRTNQWKLAAADYAESVVADPKASSNDWMVPAVLWAYAGDAEQHRRFCRKMTDRFRESKAIPDLERVLKVSSLMPQEPPIDQALAAKFREALASNAVESWTRVWFSTTQALVLCRAGDLDAAQRSIDAFSEAHKRAGDLPVSDQVVATQSVQSLIDALRGDNDRARSLMDDVKTKMVKAHNLKWDANGTLDGRTLLNGQDVLHDCLIAEIFRREAKALISQNR